MRFNRGPLAGASSLATAAQHVYGRYVDLIALGGRTIPRLPFCGVGTQGSSTLHGHVGTRENKKGTGKRYNVDPRSFQTATEAPETSAAVGRNDALDVVDSLPRTAFLASPADNNNGRTVR